MAYKFNPFTGTLDWFVDNAATGYVVGPPSSTDKAITRWDGTTGALVQDSKAFVQDGGAVEAIAFVSNSYIDQTIVVPDSKVMISSSLDIGPGGVIQLGAGSKLIVI